jgi:hypothetical protein
VTAGCSGVGASTGVAAAGSLVGAGTASTVGVAAEDVVAGVGSSVLGG